MTELNRSGSKVAFFHVMKTGGMTFRRILSSIYGDSFHLCADPSLDAVKAALAKFDCIEFHPMPYNDYWVVTHAELAAKQRWDLLAQFDVFTMLRDPVDQFLSEYFYLVKIQAQIEPVLKAKGIEFPSSLYEYMESPVVYNEQTAFLAGKHGKPGLVGQADLSEAKETLLRLHANVGLTERFADSMNVFETVTRLNIPDRLIQNQNQNASRPPGEAIPSRTRNAIRERSALDTELYRFGQDLFLEQLARCGPTRHYQFLHDASVNPTKSPIPAGDSLRAVPSAQPSRRCVYLHIPRTAGMTFRRCLLSTYEDNFHICSDPSISAIEAAMAEYNCLVFHVQPYRGDFMIMHGELARNNRWDLLEGADVFTMLRNPVDQVLSRYFHMVERRAFLETFFERDGVAFPESLSEYLDLPASFNNQLSFIVGKYTRLQKNPMTRGDLDDAKEILLRLGTHIGIFERFGNSLHIFETVTGRPVSDKIRNRNENLGRPSLAEVPDEMNDRLREQSALDQELYEFGHALFLEELGRCGPPRHYNFISGPVTVSPANPAAISASIHNASSTSIQNESMESALWWRARSSLSRMFGKRSTPS